MRRICASLILTLLTLASISLSVSGQEKSSLDPKLAVATDLEVPSGTVSLSLQRQIATKRSLRGPLGKGWRHNWESHLTRTAGRVQIDDWAGTTLFTQAGQTLQYVSASGDRITFTKDRRATRRTTNGIVETFDAAGRLVERAYSRGGKFSLRYDAQGRLMRVEGSGRTFLSFSTDPAGRATRVEGSSGAAVRYAYDKDDLTEAQINGGAPLRYAYDAKGALIKVEDPQTGDLEIAYDAKERVASYRLADGSQHRFEFDESTNTRRVIAPDGAVTTTHQDLQNRRTEVTDPLGHKSVIQFDDAGHPVSVTGPTGRLSRLGYDLKRRLVTSEDALGNTSRYEYFGDSSALKAILDGDGTRQEFEYDADKNLAAIRIDGKIVGALTYNPDGSIASAKEPGAKERKFTYHLNGLVKSEANALGDTTHFEYDARGNLVRETNPLGGITVRSYNAQGQLATLTAPMGETTQYEYDSRGRVIRETNSAGTTAFEYDVRGRLVAETNPAGETTRYEYTPVDRISKVINPGGQTESYRYDLAGNLTERTNHLEQVTKFDYDAAGRVIREQRPTGLEVRYRYDAAGNLLAFEDSSGTKSEYQVDALGRTTARINPDRGKIQYQYDTVGNLLAVTDALGRVRQFTHTADGELTQAGAPSRDESRYEYDAVGRIVAAHRPSGGVSRFTYDQMGHLLTVTDPLGNVKKYSYDNGGRLLTDTDAANKVTRYVYDKAGRRVEKQLPEGKRIAYKYDLVGRMIEADDGVFPVRFSYDEAGRVKQVEYAAIKQAIAYEYDAQGLRTRMTAPDGRETRYEYDSLKRLSAVVSPDGKRITTTYDEKSRIQSVTYPNGITGRWTYDPSGRIWKIAYQDKKGKAVAGFSYRYDTAGNPVERQDAKGQTSRFAYDAADQLIEETNPASSIKYRYAAGGNRSAVEEGGRIAQYKHDAADRVIEAGAERLSYDANGNLTGRKGPSGNVIYEYDGENRLAKVVTADGASTTFGYAPTGERVWRRDKSGITYFLYDGLNLIAELGDDLRTKTSFLHGFGIDRPLAMLQEKQSFYYLSDRMGSITHLSDNTGRVAAAYVYDAFGNVKAKQGTVASPFAFTGRELDPTGLYYYRARYYDPGLGRFLTNDLIYGSLDEPLDQNPYLYVRNNPVSFVDPLGLDVFSPEFLNGQNDDSLINLLKASTGNPSAQEQVYRVMRSRGMGTAKGDQMFFARPVPRTGPGPRGMAWDPGSPPALEGLPAPGHQRQQVVGKPGQVANKLNPAETGAAIPKPGPAGPNTQQVGEAPRKGNTLRSPVPDTAGPWKGLLGVDPKGFEVDPRISRAGLAAGLLAAAADCYRSGLTDCGPRIVGGVIVGGGIYGGIALAVGTKVAGPVAAILGGAIAWKDVGTELAQGRTDEKQREEQKQSRQAQEQVNLKNRAAFKTRLEQLRGKINALKKDHDTVIQNLPKAQQQATIAESAAAAAEKSLIGLREVKEKKGQLAEAVCSTINTAQPAAIMNGIDALAAQAETKQRESDRLLSEGRQSVASCPSTGDARAIRDSYAKIKPLLGQIDSLKTQAEQKKAALDQVRRTVESLTAQTPAKVSTDVADRSAEADAAAKEAATLVTQVRNSIEVLEAGKNQLRREINAFQSGVPEALVGDIQDEINGLHGLLSSLTQYPQLVRYDDQALDSAKRAATLKDEALRILESWKSSFPCQIEIPSADASIQRLESARTMTGINIAASADFLREAQVCEASAKCIPLINKTRQLLEQLEIDGGIAGISQARQQGCNVEGLETSLDYYRTIRDAVAVLFNAKEQCKFQQGVTFADKMPASMQANPWLANGIAEVRAGLAAQQRVEQLISKARTAADAGSGLSARNSWEESRRQFAQADGYVAQADSIAAPYSCLAERVSRYKGEYSALKENVSRKGGGQVATTGGSEKPGEKLEVEEIPEDTGANDPAKSGKTQGGGFWDRTKEKAGKGNEPPVVVEEIPEDNNRATTAVNKPPHKDTKPLEVEEIPEDNVATNPRGKDTTPLEVEEIPEDDKAVATNTGGSSNQPTGNRSSDKPKKEKKPKDPNKPGFWDRLGKAAGDTIRDTIVGGTGNTGGTTGGSTTGGSTTGGGTSNPGDSGGGQPQPSTASDISGEYESRFSNSERTIINSMTVTRTAADEWRGVIRLVSENITPCSSDSSSDLGQNSRCGGRITRDGAQYAIVFRYKAPGGLNISRPAGFSTSDGRPVEFDGSSLNWSETIPGNSKFYRR